MGLGGGHSPTRFAAASRSRQPRFMSPRNRDMQTLHVVLEGFWVWAWRGVLALPPLPTWRDFCEEEPEKEGESRRKDDASVLRVRRFYCPPFRAAVHMLPELMVSMGQPACQPEVGEAAMCVLMGLSCVHRLYSWCCRRGVSSSAWFGAADATQCRDPWLAHSYVRTAGAREEKCRCQHGSILPACPCTGTRD